MRLQCRLLEKLEEKIFPANRDIPTDENGDGLFRNFDTIAVPCVDPPPARPRRDHPYDNNPAPGNLHIPQSVLDHNDPDKNPGTGASPFPPIDIDKPAPKYPYHPSHGPKSAAGPAAKSHAAKLKVRSQNPETHISSSPAAPASPSPEPQGIREEVTEFTLPNGLHFIVLERHEAPVVSFHTYVNAGAVDDPKGKTGLAHMFEHMAFKGTETIGTTTGRRKEGSG